GPSLGADHRPRHAPQVIQEPAGRVFGTLAGAAYPPGRLVPTILSTFLLTKSKWARTVLFADSLVTDRLRRAGEGLPHPAAQTEEIAAIKVQRVLNFFSRRIRLRLRLRVPRLRAP